MTELRHERERRGWTLDDVVSRTRIPRLYLEALEDGNHEVLPPGPFLRGYLRQYLEFLGQDPDEDSPRAETAHEVDVVPIDLTDAALHEPTAALAAPPDEVPLLRLVAAGFVLTLGIVLALQVTARFTAPPRAIAGTSLLPIGAPQMVSIAAIEPVHITATVDGEQVFSGILKGRESMDFEAQERIAVDIKDLEKVLITYNDEALEPLHNLTRGRRLVFIRDDQE
jgi:transcriptional regulator with XRE-family HTH domain